MCAPRLCCRHEPVSGPTLDYRSNHFKRIQSFGVSVTFILSLSSHWQFFLTITNRRFVFLTGAGYTILKKQKREKTEKKVKKSFIRLSGQCLTYSCSMRRQNLLKTITKHLTCILNWVHHQKSSWIKQLFIQLKKKLRQQQERDKL